VQAPSHKRPCLGPSGFGRMALPLIPRRQKAGDVGLAAPPGANTKRNSAMAAPSRWPRLQLSDVSARRRWPKNLQLCTVEAGAACANHTVFREFLRPFM
jgi:hypothetical protein